MKKLLIKVLKRVGFLKRLKINGRITLNGNKFIIPIINEVGLGNYLNLSEPWMLYILEQLISKSGSKMTFIDVGVNLGQTLIKVKSVDPSINYIGFEPNPICVNYVNSLIALNNFSDTEIVPVGLADKSSVLKLNLYSESEVDSAASIIKDFRDDALIVKTLNVPVFKFSDIFFEKDLKAGLIKIDVEGAEHEVLKGLKDKIEADRPIMLVEVLPAYNERNFERIIRQESIQSLLIGLDYKIFRVIKINDEFLRVKEILEFGIHSDMNLCEYLFIPSELAVGSLAALGKSEEE